MLIVNGHKVQNRLNREASLGEKWFLCQEDGVRLSREARQIYMREEAGGGGRGRISRPGEAVMSVVKDGRNRLARGGK